MSSTATTSTDRKRERLERYLRRRYAEEGSFYFKSKFVADDVGLSAKEIGALVLELRRSRSGMEIEKWGYTSATTWRLLDVDDG